MFVLLCSFLIEYVCASFCSQFAECSSCTEASVFGQSCQWCPLDSKCHNPGAFLFSGCESSESYVSVESCGASQPVMQPCPSIWPGINDLSKEKLSSGWMAYPGDPFFYHCSFRGIIENRSTGMLNECFYDESGTLVSDNHPWRCSES